MKPFLLHRLGALALAGGLIWMILDAHSRRTAQSQRSGHVDAVVSLLGTADLALSSASRWLRHPTLSEPGAAFADAPAILDADPAGAVISPPRAALADAVPGRSRPWPRWESP